MHYVYLRDYRKGRKDNMIVGEAHQEHIANLLSLGVIKPAYEEGAEDDTPKQAKKAASKPAKKKTSKKK